MPRYTVQMQDADGSIVDVHYATRWDAEKVSTEEVAKACAAESTVKAGKTIDGEWRHKYAGISAVLAA